jgi:DNA invertase Pin-like site-specific DNA recombinase
VKAPNEILAAVYCRLSREDDKKEDASTSIKGQETMITDYITERGWTLVDVYKDDGYSGTNFDARPDFMRLIRDIEKGKVNCIVVRDLSRFGRNYAKAGYYLEEYFPEHRVRFIAVNDNFDTAKGEDDITPFKNVFNEMYAKDISGKTKSAKRTYAKQGKFLGSVPPFGYKRSAADKHVLEIDAEQADIVKRIFHLYTSGVSMRNIADLLNSESILSPRAYYYRSKQKPPPANESLTWSANTIRQLMKSIVYCGHMAQCKRKSLSYKSKIRLVVPEDDWVIVKNTHEPIIDEALWQKANDLGKTHKQHRVRTSASGTLSLFAGVAFCEQCGSAMSFSVNKYRCSRYNVHGSRVCSPHTISYDALYDAILADIQHHAVLVEQDEKKVIERLEGLKSKQKDNKLDDVRKRIRSASSKEASVIELAHKLFEEKAKGNIPDALFKMMMQKYEIEQDSQRNIISNLSIVLAELEATRENLLDWTRLIKQYTKIDKLDRETILALIERIEIGERALCNGSLQQKITIVYRFAGNVAA